MKKLIITIILLILIALGFIVYKNYSSKTISIDDEKNTATVVKNFLNKMIPHHEEAIKISSQVMNDRDITEAKVRILAANIVDNQSFEISKMKNIYSEFLGSDYALSTSTYKNMIGDLSKLKGDELAKAYIKNMIKHHKEAVSEAKEYVRLIDKIRKAGSTTKDGLTVSNSHPAIDMSYDLAKGIIDSQEKEITVLKSW